MRKSLRVAVTATHLPLQGRLFSAKRRTKSSSLSAIFALYRKKVPGKSRYLFWRRRRDSTGFQPVVFALRTVYFMSLFAPQKAGRRVRVSLLFFAIYRKKVPGKIPIPFLAQKERLDGFSPVVFALRTVYFMSLFAPQKDGRRVRASPNKFIYTKRKSTKEKSLCFFWRRRRDSTGFQPVVFALRTVYFMSLFAPQKDGRRVRVSPNKFIYTKRKSTKEKSLCFSWRRRRDSNSRAGYPTYALSRGASSPT